MKRLTIMTMLLLLFAGVAFGQQKTARKGKVCGDPTVPCKVTGDFEPYHLPFDMGKNYTIAESEYFYGIILKSTSLKDWGDCSNPSFGEPERLDIQSLFPKNKVFAQNCADTGEQYFTGTAQKVALIGVYAGRTLTEANAFLKTVKATGKFEGVRVRRMKVGFNGT